MSNEDRSQPLLFCRPQMFRAQGRLVKLAEIFQPLDLEALEEDVHVLGAQIGFFDHLPNDYLDSRRRSSLRLGLQFHSPHSVRVFSFGHKLAL